MWNFSSVITLVGVVLSRNVVHQLQSFSGLFKINPPLPPPPSPLSKVATFRSDYEYEYDSFFY